MAIVLTRATLCATALLALAACGGGGGSSSALPAPAKQSFVQKTVTITVPGYNKAKSLRSQYVSRNTQGIGISFGASPFTFPVNTAPTAMFDVSSTSTLCTVTNASTGARSCTLSIGAPVGTDDFQVTAWSAVPSPASGFTGATALSTVSLLNQTIAAGVNTPLNLTLNGIVSSVNTTVSPSSFAAFATGGAPVTATVSVNALDAFGNVIMDSGSNWIDSNGNVLTVTVVPCVTSNGGPMIMSPSAATSVTPANPTFAETYSGGATWGTSFPITIAGTTQSIPTGTPATLSVTPTVTLFPVPTASSKPWLLTAASDGNVYFTESGAEKIGRISPAGTITEMADSQSPPWAPTGIMQGSDGNIWWVKYNPGVGAELDHIAPASFPTLTAAGFASMNPFGNPQDLVDDGAGNIYITESGNADVTYVPITPPTPPATLDGTGTFNTVTGMSAPYGIVKGGDGNIWVTDQSNGVGVINAGTHAYTAYPLPGTSPTPVYDTLGSDGNVWTTASSGNYVASITQAGVATSYAVPIALGKISGIVGGNDNAVWFAGAGPVGTGNGGIGRISLSTHAFTSYFTGFGSSDDPHGIAMMPDGTLWFTEPTANMIGRLIY